jgi:hypothetical protein
VISTIGAIRAFFICMIGDFRAQRAERQALETVEPTIVSPPAPEMRVLVYSNTGLPEQEIRARTEKLRQVASFDSDSRRGWAMSIIGRPPV